MSQTVLEYPEENPDLQEPSIEQVTEGFNDFRCRPLDEYTNNDAIDTARQNCVRIGRADYYSPPADTPVNFSVQSMAVKGETLVKYQFIMDMLANLINAPITTDDSGAYRDSSRVPVPDFSNIQLLCENELSKFPPEARRFALPAEPNLGSVIQNNTISKNSYPFIMAPYREEVELFLNRLTSLENFATRLRREEEREVEELRRSNEPEPSIVYTPRPERLSRRDTRRLSVVPQYPTIVEESTPQRRNRPFNRELPAHMLPSSSAGPIRTNRSSLPLSLPRTRRYEDLRGQPNFDRDRPALAEVSRRPPRPSTALSTTLSDATTLRPTREYSEQDIISVGLADSSRDADHRPSTFGRETPMQEAFPPEGSPSEPDEPDQPDQPIHTPSQLRESGNSQPVRRGEGGGGGPSDPGDPDGSSHPSQRGGGPPRLPPLSDLRRQNRPVSSQTGARDAPVFRMDPPHFDRKLKPDIVPEWDGNPDKLVEWIEELNELSERSVIVYEQLGDIAATRLRSRAKDWYWGLSNPTRRQYTTNWGTLRDAISTHFMNRAWLERQKKRALEARYRDHGHSKEKPSDYIYRKKRLLELVSSFTEGELIMEIMENAPPFWAQIIDSQRLYTYEDLQDAVRYHEDRLEHGGVTETRMDELERLVRELNPSNNRSRPFYRQRDRNNRATTNLVGSSPSLAKPTFPKDDSTVSKNGKTPEKVGARPCRHCGSGKHWDPECKYAKKGGRIVRTNYANPTVEYLEAQEAYDELYYAESSSSEQSNDPNDSDPEEEDFQALPEVIDL